MRKKAIRIVAGVLLGAAMMWSISGCGQRAGQVETETQKQTETEIQTEAPQTETETETEPQKLITSVDYTSKDGTIKITLPDNTWKVTQDADEMRVFQSGNAAIINIVHANTETALKNIAVMTSEDELKASLTKQYSDETAYDIKEFTTVTVNNVNVYRYVVKYNLAARMWAYSVTNAVVATGQAYVVTGTVTDDNATLLEAVKTAVESFKVLNDDELKGVTGQLISGTTQDQKTTEKVETDTASVQELTSLQDYGTTATLVTTDTVNMRSAPGTDSSIMTTLTGNTKVSVVGETKNWFKVNINGNIGYIRKDFLVYGNTQQTTNQTDAQQNQTSADAQSSAEIGTATNYGSATTLYASSDVNIRTQPGTDSAVSGALSTGTSVTVTGETDNWFIVSVGGTTGYVSKAYLTGDSSVATGTTAESQNTGTSGNTGTTNSTASYISGTVVGTTADSITIQASDGSTKTIYYGEANVSTQDGLYDGVYVEAAVDGSQTWGDGTLVATNVTGY